MEKKIDYKKEFKDLYLPKRVPALIQVPAINFIMIQGKGNPNDEQGEYKSAVELLYGLSYTIKMSKMGKYKPSGYFDYVVPPLEGLWWIKEENKEMDFTSKEKFCWISMIRQPEFVTEEVFKWACSEMIKKKPELDIARAKFDSYDEGLCVQIMHIGPYDNEPYSIEKIENYMESNKLKNAISDKTPTGKIRKHHEIYLSDPRKTELQKLKTILRVPVKYE